MCAWAAFIIWDVLRILLTSSRLFWVRRAVGRWMLTNLDVTVNIQTLFQLYLHYGRREVDIPCHLRVEFKGSQLRIDQRTRSLVTLYPSDRNCPQINDWPTCGCCTILINPWSVLLDCGSTKSPNSTLLRYTVIRETINMSAMGVHEKERERKYCNCSLEIWNLGLPRPRGNSVGVT